MAGQTRFGIINGTMKQPKPKYRFRVTFDSFPNPAGGSNPLTLETNTCGKPSMNYEEQVVHSYNSRAYYAGKYEWQTLELVVRDAVDSAAANAINAQMRAQQDHIVGGTAGGQASPVNASYKFTMKIDTLDGDEGQGVLDSWTLEGCWFQSVNFGDFDYSSSEQSTITMTVRYDNAIYVEGGEKTDTSLTA